ncbi:hypothetical protein OH77DRAFT_1030381 [Trametes cingulata]|nr:hypothetical protein OH77DRAFT_1030381 [Trametes cingulata]
MKASCWTYAVYHGYCGKLAESLLHATAYGFRKTHSRPLRSNWRPSRSSFSLVTQCTRAHQYADSALFQTMKSQVSARSVYAVSIRPGRTRHHFFPPAFRKFPDDRSKCKSGTHSRSTSQSSRRRASAGYSVAWLLSDLHDEALHAHPPTGADGSGTVRTLEPHDDPSACQKSGRFRLHPSSEGGLPGDAE